ncbi:MAG: DNA-protecting protein DprA [Gemmatimonadetes bacterium]|nr:DNA-protecting protein DprA [Gemmatimonadota bacterium]
MTTSGADTSLHALALAGLPGIGPVALRRLLAVHPSVQEAFAARVSDDAAAAAALTRAERVRARCAERGIAVLAQGDAQYPVRLLDLEDAPTVVYALGAPQLTERPAVALVGARRATGYGRVVVRNFARRLADAGVCVVSGLAMGIDAEAHAATLEGAGATIAVQGTGVDVPYPRSNTALHARIARDGLVLSELAPGRPAHPGAFPRRNRLIAALADVVLVVEAGVRSGALITAQLGDALGRFVAAVPGPIDSESSVGANQLLRDGAHVVASFDDLSALLALTPRGRVSLPRSSEPLGARSTDASVDFPDDSPEGRVLAVLGCGPQATDDLVHACAISPRAIGIALSNLSMVGAVAFDASGLVRRLGGTLSGAPGRSPVEPPDRLRGASTVATQVAPGAAAPVGTLSITVSARASATEPSS